MRGVESEKSIKPDERLGGEYEVLETGWHQRVVEGDEQDYIRVMEMQSAECQQHQHTISKRASWDVERVIVSDLSADAEWRNCRE